MRVAEWLWRTWWEQTWCGQRRSTAAELTAWPILHTGRHNKPCSPICTGIPWRFYLDPSPLQYPPAGLRQWWLFPGRPELWTPTSVSLCTSTLQSSLPPPQTLNPRSSADSEIADTRTSWTTSAGFKAAPTASPPSAGTTSCFTTRWGRPTERPTPPCRQRRSSLASARLHFH